MHRFVLSVSLALFVIHCYGAAQQVQMPETAELHQPDDDLRAQIKELQKNVTDIWTYIYELRNAVSGHLNHLRQHQVELENSMHTMEHLHESELHSAGHHHSGEQHSHSGEQHSHGGDHSHSGDHSHGGDHSHSGEQHSHGDDHSHSGEHHSHSDEHGHHSTSYSHSHTTSHDHGAEDGSHSHGDDHDHKDSHETEDLQQQTQQVAGPPPVDEPAVVSSRRQEPYHRHADGMNLMNENNHHHHHHHSHHDSSSRRMNRTVELPKYSDYGLYDIALCDVTPNRAIPEEQQQNIAGTITLWQKKPSGPLNIHVGLRGFNVDDHHGHHQAVQEEQNNVTPQPVSHRHGFHVHTLGDLSNGCQSTGSHFNPKGVTHGAPNSANRHVGDLGMIECDEHGVSNLLFSDDIASLSGPYSIVGKSMNIHAHQDDLGLGGNDESLKTGNSGTRVACCVIRKVDKIPIRQHRAMKTAKQYKNY